MDGRRDSSMFSEKGKGLTERETKKHNYLLSRGDNEKKSQEIIRSRGREADRLVLASKRKSGRKGNVQRDSEGAKHLGKSH